MDALTPEEFQAKVNKDFPLGMIAISEDQDFQFMGVVRHVTLNSEGRINFLLFPDSYKNFVLTLTGVEEKPDEWLVSTTTGRWAWRHPTEELGTAYIAALRKEGFNV